eukprot:2098370-Amphidinium_carterae.1
MASQYQSSTSQVAINSKGLTAPSKTRRVAKAARQEASTLLFSQYKVRASAGKHNLAGAQKATGRKLRLPLHALRALTCVPEAILEELPTWPADSTQR